MAGYVARVLKGREVKVLRFRISGELIWQLLLTAKRVFDRPAGRIEGARRKTKRGLIKNHIVACSISDQSIFLTRLVGLCTGDLLCTLFLHTRFLRGFSTTKQICRSLNKFA